MKIVCAWCKQEGRSAILGEREPFDDPTETHGVCSVHSAKLMEQLPSASFPGVRMLVVVRKTETELFEHLTRSFAGVPNVAVILDRRHEERRQTPGDVDRERRQTERRIRKSQFSGLGYFIVRFGVRHQEAFTLPPVRKLRVV
jgi:hypothetical protein